MIHEITKKGVEEALEHPRDLDENRYNAQQARRILDRLVGYQVSPILWKKVQDAASPPGACSRWPCGSWWTGRRRSAPSSPEEYWTIDAALRRRRARRPSRRVWPRWTARRRSSTNAAGGRGRSTAEVRAAAFDARATWRRKEARRYPAPPFITSTLQRDAFRKLRYSAKKTMMVAQRLYEGVDVEGEPVGLITYMRTDSTRMSADAVAACRESHRAHRTARRCCPPSP